jgi:protein ImuA
MRLITCDRGRLHALFSQRLGGHKGETFSTGLEAVDALLPQNGLPRGAVHEILAEPPEAWKASPSSPKASPLSRPFFFAMLLARAAADNESKLDSHRAIVWCDPARTVYAPALAAAGIGLDRLYLVRPKTSAELLWAMGESLRCPGVAATIAAADRLSRLEARRLQLAAETGGGVGLLLRSLLSKSTQRAPGRCPPIYAAATRWLIGPAPGEANVQRWKIRLIHCHGGNTEQTLLLEHHRETNSVRAIAELADRLGGNEGIGARRVVGA